VSDTFEARRQQHPKRATLVGRPRPVGWIVHQPSFNRVVVDVRHGDCEMLFVTDRPLEVPRLEESSASLVSLVEGAGVGAVEHPHPTRDFARRLNHQVVVGVHEAHRVQHPAIADRDAAESERKGLAIAIVDEDWAVVDSVGGEVIRPSWDERARVTTHLRNVAA
jgi:hypothetical protein